MPAWVQNQLVVKGPAKKISKFKKQAVGFNAWGKPTKKTKPSPLNFHSLVPIPDDVLKQEYSPVGNDWEWKNWGCKWGSCEAKLIQDSGFFILYRFTTPWSPPDRFLKKLGVLWPDLTFVLDYIASEGDGENLPFEIGTDKDAKLDKSKNKLLEEIFGDITWEEHNFVRGITKVHGNQCVYFTIDI